MKLNIININQIAQEVLRLEIIAIINPTTNTISVPKAPASLKGFLAPPTFK